MFPSSEHGNATCGNQEIDGAIIIIIISTSWNDWLLVL